MVVASFWDTLSGILDALLNLIGQLIYLVDYALIVLLNLVIVGLGTIISAAISLLPGMPTLPTFPGWLETGMFWSSYWFPMPYFLTTLTLVATLWLAWLIVRIPLRWGKANPE